MYANVAALLSFAARSAYLPTPKTQSWVLHRVHINDVTIKKARDNSCGKRGCCVSFFLQTTIFLKNASSWDAENWRQFRRNLLPTTSGIYQRFEGTYCLRLPGSRGSRDFVERLVISTRLRCPTSHKMYSTLQSPPSKPHISCGEAFCSNTDISTRNVTIDLNYIGICKYCLWYSVFMIARSFSLHSSLPPNLNFLLCILRQIYLVRAKRTKCMMRTGKWSSLTYFIFFLLLRSLYGILLNFQWHRKCI
jgi:hypothetical protein